ncbi:MAG: hypothetical protein E7399_03250 [Ruminococcaceae bacterium]|nr:hypothetical protein [Oscillospiraceae bacterium]
MKLKQVHIGAFGGLSDCKKELSPGLNVICGENGAGKSTFFAFLKTCFYSFARGEREKFLPWNGTTAHGTLVFDQDGEWLLQAKFGKTARGDKISLLNNLTGEEQSISSSLGRELFSMGEETFLKTACVAQGQLEISAKGQDEIAEKLANLEQTGESGISYAACKKILVDMETKLRAKRGNGGVLNEAEQKVLEYQEKERLAKEQGIQSAALYRRMEEIQQETDQLQETEQQWRLFEQWEQKQLCMEYQEKLKQLSCLSEGADEEYEIYEVLAREWKQEEENLLLLKAEDLNVEKPKPVLCSPEEFSRVMAGTRKPLGLMLGSVALAVISFLCGILISPWFFCATALSVLGVLLHMVRKQKQPWEAYGFSSSQEFSQAYTRSLEQQSAYELAVIQRQKRQEQIAILQKKINEYEEKGKHLHCATPEQLFALCNQRRTRQAERKSALAQKETYEELLQKALAGNKIEDVLEAIQVNKPFLSKEELHLKQLDLAREKEQLETKLQHLYEISPEVLTASRMEWEQKRNQYRKKEQILSVVSEVMESAYQQMEQQFGGSLNQRAGEWLKRMTDGKYNQVRISRNYDVKLTEKSQAHSLEHFSGGVYDQTYLAFRLAMLELMKTKTPLFLDDVLMQYDDKRAEQTIDALADFSEQTGLQILLFTCRNRDFQLSKQRKNINCLEIL